MCDTIVALGASTAGGTTLFGKNSDRDYREAQYLELIPRRCHLVGAQVKLTHVAIDQVAETNQILISKPHWIWGAEIGVNEYGLAIGNEAIFATVAASLEPGVIGMDFVRLALERARTASEGVNVITELLARYGQSGNCGFTRPLAYCNSFLLADPCDAKVLETVDRDWVVRSIASHYAISNAITIEKDFDATSLESLTAPPLASFGASRRASFKAAFEDETKSASGCYRRARAMAMLGSDERRLTAIDFFEILRDHLEGPSVGSLSRPRICAHRRESTIGQTTASWVSDLLPERRLHWVTATAAPCTSLFKPVCLEVGLPSHGPCPGSSADVASLWWRHEQLRAALDAVGETLLLQFTDERDAIQTQFLSLMTDFEKLEIGVLKSRIERCWRVGLAFEQSWLDRLSTSFLTLE